MEQMKKVKRTNEKKIQDDSLLMYINTVSTSHPLMILILRREVCRYETCLFL
jgi:hypothetical protein